MKIKGLIAIDIDGTLLTTDYKLLPHTEEVISHLSDAGYLIVLATGRPKRAVEEYYDRLHCQGPLICYNGHCCYDPKNPAFPRIDLTFSEAEVKAIYHASKHIVTSFLCESHTDLYSSNHDPFLETYFWSSGIKKNIGDIDKTLHEAVYAVVMGSAKEHDEELRQICESAGKGICWRHWTGVDYSEIAREGADKSACLLKIMEYYGIAKKDVICFGDSDNDGEMLSVAGKPFVMCSGRSKKLKEIYPSTRLGNDEEGVADTLVSLFPELF